jgi:ATP-dependent helicase/nuclease subunit B
MHLSLELVIGASGAGKTEYIYRKLIDSAISNPEVRHIMLVPEQFTMQTQRRLVSRHPGHGLLNIDVVSFDRLAFRIFEETGTGSYQLLDDIGKSMLLRRSAGEHRGKLGIFSGNLSRSGFISRMRSMISELYEYDVTSGKLREVADRLDGRPVLRDKLRDLSVIYDAFEEKLDTRTIPAEEVLPLLISVLPSSVYLKDAGIAADDFTGFTDVQYGILKSILTQCRSFTAALTLPAGARIHVVRPGELFSLSKRTAQELFRLADECRVSVKLTALPQGGGIPWRFRTNEELAELEKYFMRPGKRLGEAGIKDNKEEHKGDYKEACKGDHKEDYKEDYNEDRKGDRKGDHKEDHKGIQGTGSGSERASNVNMSDEKMSDNNTFQDNNTLQGKSHIVLKELRDPSSEAFWAAASIRTMVREHGFRYRDIAVIVSDLERYRSLITEAFDEAGIAFFMDRKKGIMSNPLIELVRSALQVLLQNFSYDSMFRFLRSGLAGIDKEETDLLDNYVHGAGIRGASAWQADFTRSYKNSGEIDFKLLNDIRARAIEPLLRFRQNGKGKVTSFTAAIRTLVEELDASSQMEVWAERFEAAGDSFLAKEYAGSKDALFEMLDKADALLGEERMSVREFAEMLDAGINEYTTGAVPHYLDQVQVGDLNRSRLTELKALIFIGMNDDVLPAKGGGGGILTEDERAFLRDIGMNIAPDERELADQEKYYLYRVLTKPSEYLLVSWSRFTNEGSANRPSRYIAQLKRACPDICIDYGGTVPVVSHGGARRLLAEGAGSIPLQGLDKDWTELFSVIKYSASRTGAAGGTNGGHDWTAAGGSRTADDREAAYDAMALDRIAAALAPKGGDRKLERALELVYGRILPGSISQLESFAVCPYSYFLNYDLRLKPRPVHEFDPMDRGNFFHIALQAFFALMEKEGLSPERMDEATRTRLTEESVLEAISMTDPLMLKETARTRYFVKRWKRIADRTLWAVIEEMLDTGFRPAGTELAFTGKELESLRWRFDRHSMILRGRIDRLDICAEDGRAAYRIVDYKTGDKTLDLSEIDSGRSLQLPIYLSAAEEIIRRAGSGDISLEDQPDGGKLIRDVSRNSGELLPSGAYYFKVKEPLIAADALLDEGELDKKLKGELKLKGIRNPDDCISASEDNGRRQELMADTRHMKLLVDTARRKAAELGQDILAGRIEAVPYRKGGETGCDWCAFRSVCGFDQKLPGYHFRKTASVKPDEIWEKWEAEDEGGPSEAKDADTERKTAQMPKDGTEVDSDESVKSASGQNDGPDQDHASAEGVKSGLAQKDGPKA